MKNGERKRKVGLLIGLAALSVTAGCVSPAGSESPTSTHSVTENSTITHSPTATPSLDLPSEVDQSSVRKIDSFPDSVQASIRDAIESDQWVILGSDELSALGDGSGYVYADDRLWEYRVHQGTKIVDANPTNETDGEAVATYENLSSQQQQLFEKATEKAGPHTIGPDETVVDLPSHVRHQDQVYTVSVGTKSLDAGLDVDPYED